MPYALCLLLLSLLCLSPSAAATRTAPSDSLSPHERRRSFLFGMGHNELYDSYLSPLVYRGWSASFDYQGQRQLRHTARPWLRVQQLHLSLTAAENLSQTANFYDFYLQMGYAWLRRYASNASASAGAKWHWGIGPSAGVLMGGTYAPRNGNNPAQAQLSAEVGLCAFAERDFRLASRRLTWHTQLQLPLLGLMFAPDYGQSYYEIFSLGHTRNNLVFTTPFSAPSARWISTLTLPLGRRSFTVGYQADIRQSAVNHLRRHAWQHCLVLGFVQRLQILPR